MHQQNSFAVFLVLCATPRPFANAYSCSKNIEDEFPQTFQILQGTHNYECNYLWGWIQLYTGTFSKLFNTLRQFSHTTVPVFTNSMKIRQLFGLICSPKQLLSRFPSHSVILSFFDYLCRFVLLSVTFSVIKILIVTSLRRRRRSKRNSGSLTRKWCARDQRETSRALRAPFIPSTLPPKAFLSPVKWRFFYVYLSMSPSVRESKTFLDSGFHALDSWSQVLDCEFFVRGTWIPDSNRYWDSGFQSPGFQIPKMTGLQAGRCWRLENAPSKFYLPV